MGYTFHFGPILQENGAFIAGALLTLQISVCAAALGIVLGVVCAAVRSLGGAVAKAAIGCYVELVRNTPLLVQLYFFYFSLPQIGLRVGSTGCAIIGMGIHFGAYATDIVDSGLKSVHRGQVEAGTALGLSKLKVLRLILFRPALRAVYPALGSQFILLLLGSSLASAIAVEELTGVSNTIMNATFRNFEVFIIAGVLYYVMATGLQILIGASYRRLFTWQ